MRISDWSSDVCSSDLADALDGNPVHAFFETQLAAVRDQRRIAVVDGQRNALPLLCIFLRGRLLGRCGPDREDQREKQYPRVIRVPHVRLPEFWYRRHLTVRKWRSEEHTSELQSLMRISYAVFCLKQKNLTHLSQL